MTDSRYRRVSRARPCLICGKPDWCSRTADDSISFCARVTTGADHLSRKEKWGVFYHNSQVLTQSFRKEREKRNFKRSEKEEVRSAPLEIRDFVYSTLVRLSPASDYHVLIDGRKGLHERRLENTRDYGGLPGLLRERQDLAAKIRILLNRNFPGFLRQNPLGLSHIPGFWIDEFGETNLWLKKDFAAPFLLIPYRSPAGLIQACQIRLTCQPQAEQKRYLWLSLPANLSAGSGTPLHYASWKNIKHNNILDLPVLITEGALKADVVAKLRPEYFAVANGGVSCSHDLIISISRGKSLYLAFDNDYHNNPAVIRQFAKLLKLRFLDNQTSQTKSSTKILNWKQSAKGVDDALLQGESLQQLSVLEWYNSLDNQSRDEVQNIWAGED